MKAKNMHYSSGQLFALVLLRMLIGWHFLYEGVVKLWNPGWSARSYLLDSGGLFQGLFQSMAANSSVLAVIDFLNVWGLILIGLGLLVGFLSRWAALGGIVLLAFYYLSHPPLIGVEYALPSEGSYLWVNKNLIELFALAVIMAFPTSKIFGLDRLVARSMNKEIPDEPSADVRSKEEEKVSA
jgi:thiosulfate dehydrogenase [quinone] large subunit